MVDVYLSRQCSGSGGEVPIGDGLKESTDRDVDDTETSKTGEPESEESIPDDCGGSTELSRIYGDDVEYCSRGRI